MNLTPTEATSNLVERAMERAADLKPRAPEFEKNELIPPSVFEELGEHGLMAVTGDTSFGGAGQSTVAYALCMMEIAQGCAATAVTMAVTNMVGEVIGRFGTEEQIAAYCGKLAKGGLGAFALSEVGAGSDPGGMRTTAVLDGDEWVINGTKQWISHGDTSVAVVVWARTDGDGPKGLSCFLIDGNTPGLSADKHEDKMGLRASHTVGLVLQNVRVPKSALLGERGGGFPIAMMALDGGRIGVASQALGIAEAAYAHTLHALKNSESPPEQFEQFELSTIRTELDAARLLILRAATLKDQKAPFSQEASIAKAYATESAWRACESLVEIAGDVGLRAGPIERALRDVRVTRIYEGTSEVQRIVISRGALSRT